MTTIWAARYTNEPGNPKFCRASVYSREGGSYSWLHTYQCTRKPKCTRVVDGQEYGFCSLHDPEAVKARGEARSARYRAEAEAVNREHAREKQTRAAMDACKAAIEQIAAGHNDPRSLAVEALALFPAASPVPRQMHGSQE